MIENLHRLFKVLDRWKWHYASAAVLLILGIFTQS